MDAQARADANRVDLEGLKDQVVAVNDNLSARIEDINRNLAAQIAQLTDAVADTNRSLDRTTRLIDSSTEALRSYIQSDQELRSEMRLLLNELRARED